MGEFPPAAACPRSNENPRAGADAPGGGYRLEGFRVLLSEQNRAGCARGSYLIVGRARFAPARRLMNSPPSAVNAPAHTPAGSGVAITPPPPGIRRMMRSVCVKSRVLLVPSVIAKSPRDPPLAMTVSLRLARFTLVMLASRPLMKRLPASVPVPRVAPSMNVLTNRGLNTTALVVVL